MYRYHPVHFLLFVIATMNRFDHRPENLQFGESADMGVLQTLSRA